MADGSVFVASGSKTALDPTNPLNNNPTYELLSPDGISNGTSFTMDILHDNQDHFMYPILHLLRDGSLFVLASTESQVFDVSAKTVVRQMPRMPGYHRTYPNSGGSVMLPLSSTNNYNPEIMVCGGGDFQDLPSPTDASCGRIQPLDNPQWRMSQMPEGRVMVEGILLLDGTVLWLNGAQTGAQGFGLAKTPALEALIYSPMKNAWSVAGWTEIARLYHSVALLLLDGTVLIARSNPNEQPVLDQATDNNDPKRAFPTDFRVEIFTPPYLAGANALSRPYGLNISSHRLVVGSTFQVSFMAPARARNCSVVLYHGGFVTHSLHMGQRLVYLDSIGFEHRLSRQNLSVSMPNTGHTVTPPGPYVLYIVLDGIPSVGQFVMVP